MKLKRLIAGLLAGAVLFVSAPLVPVFAADTGGKTTSTTSSEATSKTSGESTTETGSSYQINMDASGNMTVTIDGKTYTMDDLQKLEESGDLESLLGYSVSGSKDSADSEDSTESKTVNATVKKDCSMLNLRSGAGKDYSVIGELLPGDEVEILGEKNGWYEVKISEKTGYVGKDYLDVIEADSTDDTDIEASDMDSEMMMLMFLMMAQSMGNTDTTDTDGLAPDGNLTLVDDIGSTTEEGQQFITLVTKNGNYFYLVIDRDDDGNENVHFLNMVDEDDLFELMDEEDAAALKEEMASEAAEEAAAEEESEKAEQALSTEEDTEAVITVEPTTSSNSKASALPLAIAGVAVLGGAGIFTVMQKKKKKTAAEKPDPDADYDTDPDEEEYVLPEDDDTEAESENISDMDSDEEDLIEDVEEDAE